MAKITPSKRGKGDRETVVVKTKLQEDVSSRQMYRWWKAGSQRELCTQVLATASYLKENQQYRFRQAAIFSRMYANMPLFNFAGSGLNKMSSASNLPIDRPTMNVVMSCVDTLVSRITQSRPRPVFLTDNSDYKQRSLAKQLNNFINGELYQTKAYELGPLILRDAAVLGTGALKIYEDQNHRVMLDRTLVTELFVDPNDAFMNDPRSMFQVKLIDRSVLREIWPDCKSEVDNTEQAFPDSGSESARTISDQVIVVEAWHLPSGPEASDGRHVIACSGGLLFEEEYDKKDFPFVFMNYSPRLVGYWGQGLAEILMGTQVEINKMLITASQSINLMGVPRVFIDSGSKFVKAHFNNNIGMIGTYQGTPPTIVDGTTGLGQDYYAHLQRLIEYAYQQSGISQLSANSQKPEGLDSGAALREYDDIQSDRFATLNKRYDNMFIDITYKIIDKAREICEDEGSYQTVYPNKDGTKEVDLPAAKLDDQFVIQCFDSSSLPRDPAGRKAEIIDMMQAGLIDPQEGRRLLDYPDIEQVDKLANASEERILKYLDEIVEKGKYTPPDPFMMIPMAEKLVTQYYNLYEAANLEESRCQMLRDWFTQLQTLKQQSMPPMPMQGAAPQGVPMAPPQSPMLPNAPGGGMPQ